MGGNSVLRLQLTGTAMQDRREGVSASRHSRERTQKEGGRSRHKRMRKPQNGRPARRSRQAIKASANANTIAEAAIVGLITNSIRTPVLNRHSIHRERNGSDHEPVLKAIIAPDRNAHLGQRR
jgi:hypothetical protein